MEVFMPMPILRLVPTGTINLIPTRHALQASENDRYGAFELPTYVNMNHVDIFEVEIDEHQQLQKFVIREKYDDEFDISVVITKDRRIKTAWLNRSTDIHRTLDKRKYVNA